MCFLSRSLFLLLFSRCVPSLYMYVYIYMCVCLCVLLLAYIHAHTHSLYLSLSLSQHREALESEFVSYTCVCVCVCELLLARSPPLFHFFLLVSLHVSTYGAYCRRTDRRMCHECECVHVRTHAYRPHYAHMYTVRTPV